MDFSKAWDRTMQVSHRRRCNNHTVWHVEKPYLEEVGVVAELTLRRFLGMPEELHEHFDGGVDLVWAGYKVDVKGTLMTRLIAHRFLQWPAYKPLRADIVFMAGVDLERKMGFPLGWVWAGELLDSEINYDRDIPCHEIPVPGLRPPFALHTLLCRSQQEQKMRRRSRKR